MKKLVVIFALLFLIVWLSRSREAHAPTHVETAATTSSTTISPAQVDGGAVPVYVPRSRETTFTIDAANQDIIRSCLGRERIRYGRGMTLENIVEDLKSKPERLELTMNVHVRRRGGREQRLHVSPALDSGSSASRYNIEGSSVRVYDVDREGLPLSIAYPTNLRLNSLDEVLDTFIADSEVTFRERRSHEKLSETASVDLVETDGHINQLQLFADDAALGCAWQNAQLDCRCL